MALHEYPSDLTDAEWTILSPHLSPAMAFGWGLRGTRPSSGEVGILAGGLLAANHFADLFLTARKIRSHVLRSEPSRRFN